MNKDGSFLAAWEIRGQDTASSTPDELAFVSAQSNNAIRLLGTGWMLHVDSIRNSHRAYPAPEKGHFPDPVTQLIDNERRAFFSGNKCFSTSTIFSGNRSQGSRKILYCTIRSDHEPAFRNSTQC